MADDKKECTLCDKVGLKPFTKHNIYYYYIPLHGVVSYGALAVNVMNPKLVSKLVPNKDLTDVLLLSTLFGTSFFLYGRPHLRTIPNGKRGLYSLLGGTLFSMGSLLMWAVLRRTVPNNNAALATVLGLASGAVIVKLSTDYFDECDKLVAGK
ncbi:uncharacterized protein LOC129920023 [Episyrphus balteatus]|uniref:uncharacterized protein LOC129920023 n=1 Tax=Episyrphus balteatus TaxID=286459 RepID=UPI0024851060|nr:uncharacterized protein LOC129920023 [Episyrphus balteatus]